MKIKEVITEGCTVLSRLNAGGVYLKLGPIDPAFVRTRRFFGARRLIEKILQPFAFFFFGIISSGSLLNYKPNFNKNVKKM